MGNSRVVAAAVLVFVVSSTAGAQNSRDHLTCYKISDPLGVKATANLDTALLGVSTGCSVSKAAMLCAPSSLLNLSPAPTTASLGGPRSPGERLCYKVKCPTPPPASRQITDAFGTRTLTKFKTSMVCAPAVAAAATAHSGFDHYPRGLAQLAQTTTANGPTLHVRSLDGLDPATPDSFKSSTGDPGGSGVVVVLQNASEFGVQVRDDRNSTASLPANELRVGAALSVRGHGGEKSESMADELSVAVGSSGVSSTAYFPRLQRQAAAPSRSGSVSCAGVVAGSAAETAPGDPNWTWFSPVWPDRYETRSNATTDEAVFVWENGCVAIRPPDGSGSVLLGDRLVISMDNGSAPELLHRMQITGSGGLAAFALKDEAAH